MALFKPGSAGREPRREGELAPGMRIGGVELRRMVARDNFCSLWQAGPLREGQPDTCIRIIPRANLLTSDPERRLRSELDFWLNLHSDSVVDLYQTGQEGDYLYMLMRYLPSGSLLHQLGHRWHGADAMRFAIELAAALRDVHASVGPHGNLKPTNVFPVPGKGVLLSDFMLSLWVDELAAGSEIIERRLLHRYRAPEQRRNPREYDPRSDVYAFGLILRRCISGAEPAADGRLAAELTGDWIPELAEIDRRCLEADPNRRFADGLELFEALTHGSYKRPSRAVSRPAPPAQVDNADPAAQAVSDARELIEQGLLEDAVEVLEALPAGTPGMAELLDEIEKRHSACEELVREAVRLAGMGNTSGAAEAVAQAEKLWANCPSLKVVKADLSAAAANEEALRTGQVPAPLLKALEEERYDEARALIEKLLSSGQLNDQTVQAIRRFKRDRVRKAVLDAVRNAKELYSQGRLSEAQQSWLEAARWLPHGPHRQRLLKIATAAGKGKLRMEDSKPEPAPVEPPKGKPPLQEPAPSREPMELPPELQQRLRAVVAQQEQQEGLRRKLLLTLAGVVIGGLLAILIYLIAG